MLCKLRLFCLLIALMISGCSVMGENNCFTQAGGVTSAINSGTKSVSIFVPYVSDQCTGICNNQPTALISRSYTIGNAPSGSTVCPGDGTNTCAYTPNANPTNPSGCKDVINPIDPMVQQICLFNCYSSCQANGIFDTGWVSSGIYIPGSNNNASINSVTIAEIKGSFSTFPGVNFNSTNNTASGQTANYIASGYYTYTNNPPSGRSNYSYRYSNGATNPSSNNTIPPVSSVWPTGAGLQYLIYPLGQTPPANATGGASVISGQAINAPDSMPNGGQLYFRIVRGATQNVYDPITPPTGYQISMQLPDRNVLIQFVNDAIITPITMILQKVITATYGGIVDMRPYFNTIRTLMVMAVIFYAVGFLIGMIEMNFFEVVKRVVKLAVVQQLLSFTNDGNDLFLNQLLMQLFIDGKEQLINLYINVGGLYDTTNGSVYYGITLPTEPNVITPVGPQPPNPVTQPIWYTNPILKYGFIDYFLSTLFSDIAWKKITSMIFAGLFGFIMFIMILIGIVIFIIALCKAFLVYIVSMFLTAILIAVAPIFIPLILFQFTQKYFDHWLKLLFSYMIQDRKSVV